MFTASGAGIDSRTLFANLLDSLFLERALPRFFEKKSLFEQNEASQATIPSFSITEKAIVTGEEPDL
jgi:hypothetical protein